MQARGVDMYQHPFETCHSYFRMIRVSSSERLYALGEAGSKTKNPASHTKGTDRFGAASRKKKVRPQDMP